MIETKTFSNKDFKQMDTDNYKKFEKQYEYKNPMSTKNNKPEFLQFENQFQ